MNVGLILNGIYRQLTKGETVHVKKEYVTMVLRDMEERGLICALTDRDDGRVDFRAENLTEIKENDE